MQVMLFHWLWAYIGRSLSHKVPWRAARIITIPLMTLIAKQGPCMVGEARVAREAVRLVRGFSAAARASLHNL